MNIRHAALTALMSITASSSCSWLIPENRAFTSLSLSLVGMKRFSELTVQGHVASRPRPGPQYRAHRQSLLLPEMIRPWYLSSAHIYLVEVNINPQIISQSIPNTSTPPLFPLSTPLPTLTYGTRFANIASSSPQLKTCMPSSHPYSPLSRLQHEYIHFLYPSIRSGARRPWWK